MKMLSSAILAHSAYKHSINIPLTDYFGTRQITDIVSNAAHRCQTQIMWDEIDIHHCQPHDGVKTIINDWVDYGDNNRYQWDLARRSPKT